MTEISEKEIEAAARAVATADWRFEIDEFREPERWTEAVDAYNLTNNNWRFRYDEIACAALEAAARVRAEDNAEEPVEALVEQIGALLALNKTGNVSHPIPGLAVKLLERSKAALSARTVGKPEPSGWRPIETAPKDGTPIITCVAGFEPMVSARWIEYEGKAMFSEDPDTFMKEDHFSEYFHNISYYPTHWMPLPTPPKAGGDDE